MGSRYAMKTHGATEKVVIHYYLLRRESDTVTRYDKTRIKILSGGDERL